MSDYVRTKNAIEHYMFDESELNGYNHHVLAKIDGYFIVVDDFDLATLKNQTLHLQLVRDIARSNDLKVWTNLDYEQVYNHLVATGFSWTNELVSKQAILAYSLDYLAARKQLYGEIFGNSFIFTSFFDADKINQKWLGVFLNYFKINSIYTFNDEKVANLLKNNLDLLENSDLAVYANNYFHLNVASLKAFLLAKMSNPTLKAKLN